MYTRNLLRRLSSCKSLRRSQACVAPSSSLNKHGYRNLNVFTTIATVGSRSTTSANFQRIIIISEHLDSTLCKVARRTMVLSAMTDPVTSETNGETNNVSQESTVIRFQPGDERFQMQITLENGKVFNFDRKCTDSLSSVVTRMVTNIGKKVKNFNGVVKFLTHNLEVVSNDGEEEIQNVLLRVLESPPLKLQVGDHVYEVVFNPPEIYAVKFFSIYMPNFPLFPYRLETSENFCKEKSLYKWEFSQEKPTPVVPPKMRKKSKDESTPTKPPKESQWTVCGNDIIFTPSKDMEGGYLRFTCVPSNGSTFGKPFSITLNNPVAKIPVESFLFQERLSRLAEKSLDKDNLRILSYNVLADTYATPEWFISSPSESLDVGYRLPILNSEIKAYQADLICLQEVDDKFFEGNFLPYLTAQGYDGFHTCKIGNTKEGIATFYNPSKLTLLKTNTEGNIFNHIYHIHILEQMKTLFLWEKLKAVGNDFIKRLEERNTVFQLSAYKVNNCPKNTILLVGNVHLYFHPDADHIRLLQTITCIKFLEAKVAQYKREYPDQRVAVIFCGDFNCTPPFSSFRLLTTGKVDESDEDWTSHSEEKIVPGISFSHCLNLTNSHPGEELTNITTCFEGCLDYILYQSEHLEVCGTCPPPNKEKLAVLTNVDEPRKVSLPNLYAPSDHLPIITDLKFKS